jgi:uncharacterized phage protein (TIGR02220 family)
MFAKLLFSWLIPNTDNLGRMEGDTAILKGMIFPYENKITVQMVDDALKELSNEYLIMWYSIGGNWYIQFPKSSKYQILDKNNAKKSDYPEPPQELVDKYNDYFQNVEECIDMYLHAPCEGEEKEKGIEGEENIPFADIVDYLNSKTGSKYKHNTAKTRDSIKARWNDGFRVDDFIKVIDNKATEWLNDSKMSVYLRPETLFGNKFESYLNQHKGGGQAGSGTNGQDKQSFTYDKAKLCGEDT